MANAAGISRVLAGAYFMRSRETATRIRGWHNFSEGFVAEDHGSMVVVGYNFGGFRNEGTEERREAMLAAIYEVLAKRGYNAEVRSHSVVVRSEVNA
jgi:hypothetical protein